MRWRLEQGINIAHLGNEAENTTKREGTCKGTYGSLKSKIDYNNATPLGRGAGEPTAPTYTAVHAAQPAKPPLDSDHRL
jgi:hypothetical protein